MLQQQLNAEKEKLKVQTCTDVCMRVCFAFPILSVSLENLLWMDFDHLAHKIEYDFGDFFFQV
jgi:hypothetical protein